LQLQSDTTMKDGREEMSSKIVRILIF
jgi:hypothetical protein